MEPEFYTVKQFAKLLNLSYWTILRGLEDGDIYAVRINKTYRIPKSEIARLLAVEYAKHNTET